MSGHHIRADKTCKNCNHVVELAFCPKCGQKNTETRQSFSYLFTHFIEDFTHYDTAFWKTMQNLLFRPGRLTIQYLEGKRQKFVPPVKLYIFVSFLTFFLLAVLPDDINDYDDVPGVQTEISTAVPDSVEVQEGTSVMGSVRYRDLKHYDSIQRTLPEVQKDGATARYFIRNILKVKDVKSKDEVIEKFKSACLSNFPKALFIYLPVFAFWLWFIHSKKRWMFFDHGIFTLHYFSFMLLTFSLSVLLEEAISLLPHAVSNVLSDINMLATMTWIFLYFFIAHKRIYRESAIVSHAKSLLLFFINTLFMSVLMVLLAMVLLFSVI